MGNYGRQTFSINGVAKAFLKNKFSEWYSKEIAKGLDQGQNIHDIEVNTILILLLSSLFMPIGS